MRRQAGNINVVGRILVKAARLQTETSSKAGPGRRVSTTSRSRSQTLDLVNDELAQRNITLLFRGDLQRRESCVGVRSCSLCFASIKRSTSQVRSSDPPF